MKGCSCYFLCHSHIFEDISDMKFKGFYVLIKYVLEKRIFEYCFFMKISVCVAYF